MKKLLQCSMAAAFVAAFGLELVNAQPFGAGGPSEVVIHRMNSHPGEAPSQGSTSSTAPIFYHGGPVLVAPNVYVIWYGNWNQNNNTDTPAGQQIVRDFLHSIGGSPYFDINTTYSLQAASIAGSVSFSG